MPIHDDNASRKYQKYFLFFIIIVNYNFSAIATQQISPNRVVSEFGSTDFNTSSNINDAVLSNDGSFIATTAEDRTIRLIDSSTGKILHYIKSRMKYINTLDMSNDSMLSAGGPEGVEVWDGRNNKQIDTIRYRDYRPDSFQFLSNNSLIIVDKSGGIILRDIKSHKNLIVKNISSDGIMGGCISPDKKTLALFTKTKKLIIVGLPDLSVIKALNIPVRPKHREPLLYLYFISFIPNSSFILILSDDGVLQLIDWTSHIFRSYDINRILDDNYIGNEFNVSYQVAIDAEGSKIVFACSYGTHTKIILTKFIRGDLFIEYMSVFDISTITKIIFNKDNTSLFIFNSASQMIIFSIKLKKIVAGGSTVKFALGVSTTTDSILISSIDYSSNLDIYDFRTKALNYSIKIPSVGASIDHIKYRENNIIIKFENVYYIYKLSDKYTKPIIIPFPDESFTDIALSKNEQTYASTDRDGNLILYHSITKKRLLSFKSDDDGGPICMGFTDNDETIYMLYRDKIIFVSIQNRTSRVLNLPQIGVYYLKNNLIYFVDNTRDGDSRLFRISLSTKNLKEISNHIPRCVNFLVTTDEKTIILKLRESKSVSIFAVGGHDPISTLNVGDSEIYTMFTSYDDRYLVTSCLNGAVIVWRNPRNN